MTDREKNGRRKIQKNEFVINENSFSDKIKGIFEKSLRGYLLLKK